MTPETPGKRLSSALAIGILTSAVLAAFAPLFLAEFSNWDDPHNISKNALFQPVTFQTIWFYWTTPTYSIYIPLTYTLWAIVAVIAQVTPGPDGVSVNPMFFHGLNVLIHAGSAVAAFLLLRRLLNNAMAALMGALVFALHPMQVESVGWVSGLKDVLAGGLVITTLWQYSEFKNSAKRIHYAAAIITFTLALLAKPSAMVCVPLLGVLEWLEAMTKRTEASKPFGALFDVARTAWRRLLPFVLLMLPVAIVARYAQLAEHVISPLWARPLVMLDSISFYLYKLLFPAYLLMDYSRSPQSLIESGAIWYGWVPAMLAVVAVVILAKRGKPVPAAALMLFVLAPLPVLGLTKFDFQYFSTVADHYVYLGMIGPALLAGWLLARGHRSVVWVLAVVVTIWGVRSFVQARVWHDSLTLLHHTERLNPQSRVATSNLASEYFWTGRRDLAAQYHAQSIKLDPGNPVVQANEAMLALSGGDREQARVALDELIRLFKAQDRPGRRPNVRGYLWAAEILLRFRDLDDTDRYLRAAEQTDPRHPNIEPMRRWYEKVLREQQLQHPAK